MMPRLPDVSIVIEVKNLSSTSGKANLFKKISINRQKAGFSRYEAQQKSRMPQLCYPDLLLDRSAQNSVTKNS